MFRLRANQGLLWTASLIFIFGLVFSLYLFYEDAYRVERNRGILALIITCVVTLLLVIAATAHFWFRHLWHRRPGYKRG